VEFNFRLFECIVAVLITREVFVIILLETNKNNFRLENLRVLRFKPCLLANT